MNMDFQNCLAECPVIAILRGITPPEVPDVCGILLEAGIRLLEIPLNSPDALRSIEIAAKLCAGRQIAGAGTVLTPEDAAHVHDAGGRFIVSPNTVPEVIQKTKQLGMISIPGFFTASEGLRAVHAGADFLKLFPASPGPDYLRELKAVIRVPILAVGGVNAGNIASFLKVCAGAGIGGALYKAGMSKSEIAINARRIAGAAFSQKGVLPQ